MGLLDSLNSQPDPVPEPAATLEALLAQAAGDPAFQPEFYRRLLLEQLVVLSGDAPADDPPGRRTLEAGTTLRIASLPDGRVPIFTSTARIFDKGVVTHQVNYTQLKGRNLLEMLRGKTLVLNPYSDYGKVLLPIEVAQLLEGKVLDTGRTITVEKATTVLLGQPAVYPTKMVQALQRLLHQQPRVRAAYLAWLHDPSSADPPHYLICLDVEGEMRAISQQAGHVANQFLQPHEILDIVQARQNSFTDYFDSVAPFYRRD